MTLVDTSIWVDHLNKGDPRLRHLLDAGEGLCHPLVIGELAMGILHPRQPILRMLHLLPAANTATHSEALEFISRNNLFGLGIGYIDAHLLASVRLTPNALLWTRDRRLAKVAESMKLAFHP